MKKYLLDTHIVIWILENNEQRLGDFIKILTDTNNSFFVSMASYWEMVVKSSINKLIIPDNMTIKVKESGMVWLDITLDHIDRVRKLPFIHNDPFDRLIVAQSKVENMKLLSRDLKVLQYLQ